MVTRTVRFFPCKSGRILLPDGFTMCGTREVGQKNGFSIPSCKKSPIKELGFGQMLRYFLKDVNAWKDDAVSFFNTVNGFAVSRNHFTKRAVSCLYPKIPLPNKKMIPVMGDVHGDNQMRIFDRNWELEWGNQMNILTAPVHGHR